LKKQIDSTLHFTRKGTGCATLQNEAHINMRKPKQRQATTPPSKLFWTLLPSFQPRL